MNIGILGTGFMGKVHAQIYKSIPDVNIVGMAGRDVLHTTEIANDFETRAYKHPYDLINEKDIDAIDICVPSMFHTEFVVEALKSGKHVFCETPLTYDLEDAIKMFEVSRKSDKKCMVALYDRFQSQYKYIYEYIKSGKLGKPKAVYANRRSQSHFASKDIILNLMIHDFDYICWLLGKPKSVYCNGISTIEGINEHVNAILEYDETSVTVEGSVIMPKTFPFSTSLRVVCEDGAIDLNWCWTDKGPVNDVILYPSTGTAEKLEIVDYDPYEAECKYFVDCIKGNEDGTILGIESALESVRVAVLARESFKQGGLKIQV
ncbi:MAG: Inositol 2-dehydrogenase [Firmicutes bacterium ADurb.Bin419]|nr:MAG: Inositol 2-dehydrogenase [Firmicutes bacterium ADurb.Bin419]